jgi:hypothetical protein
MAAVITNKPSLLKVTRSKYIQARPLYYIWEMASYPLAIVLAIASLAVAIAALIIAIRSSRRTAGLEPEALLVEPSRENLEETPRIRELPARRVNALAEAAVILGAEALVLFDNQGLVVETYNAVEDHGAKTAASLAELINVLKGLGFPTEAIMFKDGSVSFIVELEKVGDVTPYCLVMGGPRLITDTNYAREIMQGYVEGVIRRR